MTQPINNIEIEVQQLDEIINKVSKCLADEPAVPVVVALLSMVIMAMHPHLQGDDLIDTVETASQLLATLGTKTDAAQLN